MPSSHAQFVWFFAVTMGLFVGVRHVPGGTVTREEEARRRHAKEKVTSERENGAVTINGRISPIMPSQMHTLQTSHPRLTHTFLALTACMLAASVTASRVYLHYHTPRQVLVGCLAGTLFAISWFGITEGLRRAGVVEWALDTRLARAARVRDLVCEEDLVEIGWRVWEEKRKRRRSLRNHDSQTKAH